MSAFEVHRFKKHIGECRTYKWACMSEKSGRMKIYRWNQGNPAGRRLFDRLLEKTGNEEWDDEYLLLLIEYQKLYPASEKFEVFYAKYALAQGNAALALAIAQDGERKRRVSPVLWELLAECYERLGMRCESALYRAYLRVHCRRPLRVSVSAGEEQRYLDLFTCAARMGPYAPYISRENASLMYCRRRIRIGWAPTSSAGS